MMSWKIYKPEEIIAKLRQVEVLMSQGKTAIDAIRSIGVADATYYRWRQEYGGLKVDQIPHGASAHSRPVLAQLWSITFLGVESSGRNN
jgi:hypothetical protein